jgi:hypothetical protein
MKYESRGLVVNVVRPPMMVSYTVAKGNWGDYQGKPLSENPRMSYFVVTVRDNSTQAIVLENGYGDVYSMDGTTKEETRDMVIYNQGTYHITFRGNMVDAVVTISTGDSPDQVTVIPVATPAPEEPEEMDIPMG